MPIDKRAPNHNNSMLPPAVTLVKLREHFKHKYKLSEPQVEIMVVSSAKSLEEGLKHLAEAADSVEEPVAQVAAIYHGLKGLFLNMGEEQWAAYTRDIEQKMLAGDRYDHLVVVSVLRDGMSDILGYSR